MLRHVSRVVVSEMCNAIISESVAAELLCVGVENHVVRTGRNEESVVGERACRTEVEHEDKVAAHVGENLVAVVVPYLLHRSLLEVLLELQSLQHIVVEVAEELVVEVGIVDEIPLAACVFMAPAVAFAWKVDPLRMSELITHEVEVTAVDGRSRNEANHLVECYAAMSAVVLVATTEVPVHIGVDETEDDCLVAHECLVVALAVADSLLVRTAVGCLPEDRAWLPSLVWQFLDSLYPQKG